MLVAELSSALVLLKSSQRPSDTRNGQPAFAISLSAAFPPIQRATRIRSKSCGSATQRCVARSRTGRNRQLHFPVLWHPCNRSSTRWEPR